MTHKLFLLGVTKDARTAGPGKRFELFTKGCIRGVINPCEGCFNQETWTFEGKYREMTVDELVEIIDRDAWNRQVTFCGGEPMLQAIALTQAAKKLKELDPTFHIIMYTAYKLDSLLKYGLKFTWIPKYGKAMEEQLSRYSAKENTYYNENPENPEVIKNQFTILEPEHVKELMKYVDIIVDGDYKYQLRIPTAKFMNDGQFIGSRNQRVIYCQETLEKGELVYDSPEEFNHHLSSNEQCKCCGHVKPFISEEGLCSRLCKERFEKRDEEMKIYGGA